MHTRKGQQATLMCKLQVYNFSNFGYKTKLSSLAFFANALNTSSGIGSACSVLRCHYKLRLGCPMLRQPALFLQFYISKHTRTLFEITNLDFNIFPPFDPKRSKLVNPQDPTCILFMPNLDFPGFTPVEL